MRVFLTALGCKLNQAEIESMARRLVQEGHEIVTSLDRADLRIVNTCTVTREAARDSRRISRQRPADGRTVPTLVTGCYATDSPVEAARLAGVIEAVPNSQKRRIPQMLRNFEGLLSGANWPHEEPPLHAIGSSGFSSFPTPHEAGEWSPLRSGPARGLLDIEDGCNMQCAFCIIPTTRGRQVSRAPADIVGDLEELVKAGYREVVLTGVQISAYRNGDTRLVGLVETLLECTGIERLRLTSIAPWQFDSGLLDLFGAPSGRRRLCRHFHFSLQSGCDATLRRMRRPYTTGAFRKLVDAVRTAVPGVGITSDVIVGFPGEDEQEFRESQAFVAEMEFARLHVFSYSPRPGTPAAALVDEIGPGEKKARCATLRAVAEESQRRFAGQQVGAVLPVLIERSLDDFASGTTDNYVRAEIELPKAGGCLVRGQIVPIRVDREVGGRLCGRTVPIDQIPLGIAVARPAALDYQAVVFSPAST